MKPFTSNLVALALALPLLACGDVKGEDQEPSGADAGQDIPADTTAPKLLSSAPVDGEVGQRNDVQVVLTFSEAMDQDSVEADVDVSLLGPVTMAWNSAGDTLTIIPEEGLEYAEGIGEDPSQVVALQYKVFLGNDATDLAGNALGGAATEIGFSTLRSLSLVLSPDTNMSRVVSPSGFVFTIDQPFAVGDIVANNSEEGIRSVMTFDIAAVPQTAQSIASATLASRQLIGDFAGTPYVDLGPSVVLDHVTYLGIAGANAAFNSSQTAHSTVGDFFVEGQVVVATDVTSQLDNDLSNRVDRGDLSQFMARFAAISDVGGDSDAVTFSRELLELSVTYLHP